MQQTITSANIDHELRSHMASLGYNELVSELLWMLK